VLEPAETARLLTADARALQRLEAEGLLPAFRVDGQVRFDAALAGLVLEGDEGAAAARRAEVRSLARYEYVTGLAEGRLPPGGTDRPAPPAALAAAPRAWSLPADLPEPPPPGDALAGEQDLIRSDDVEVRDED
jgi:hypothetical protein